MGKMTAKPHCNHSLAGVKGEKYVTSDDPSQISLMNTRSQTVI